MKNLFNKIFKKNNHKNTTKSATVKKQWHTTSAHTADEMLTEKYTLLKMGYNVEIEFYNSPSFGKLWIIRYAK